MVLRAISLLESRICLISCKQKCSAHEAKCAPPARGCAQRCQAACCHKWVMRISAGVDCLGGRAPMLRRPYSLRRRVRRNLSRLRRALLSPLGQAEGMERRDGASIQSALGEARARLARRARPAALHRGDFCPRGRASGRGGAGVPRPLSGQLSPPFIRAASSHSRQSPIVGTDGDPRPPGSGVTSPARRRRIRLHHRDVSRRRPQPSRTILEYIPSSCRRQARRADAPEFLAGAGIRRRSKTDRRNGLVCGRVSANGQKNFAASERGENRDGVPVRGGAGYVRSATATASRIPGRKPCVRRRGFFPKR